MREHLGLLTSLGTTAVPVRRPEELAACDGLVIPGGESTTMVTLVRVFDLLDPLSLDSTDEQGLSGFGC